MIDMTSEGRPNVDVNNPQNQTDELKGITEYTIELNKKSFIDPGMDAFSPLMRNKCKEMFQITDIYSGTTDYSNIDIYVCVICKHLSISSIHVTAMGEVSPTESKKKKPKNIKVASCMNLLRISPNVRDKTLLFRIC